MQWCNSKLKNCKFLCSKFKTSGEDDEEEGDWWLQDQVATSSHLVKTGTVNGFLKR
jgi:hypothetical protein